jgi:hypothetical protein
MNEYQEEGKADERRHQEAALTEYQQQMEEKNRHERQLEEGRRLWKEKERREREEADRRYWEKRDRRNQEMKEERLEREKQKRWKDQEMAMQRAMEAWLNWHAEVPRPSERCDYFGLRNALGNLKDWMKEFEKFDSPEAMQFKQDLREEIARGEELMKPMQRQRDEKAEKEYQEYKAEKARKKAMKAIEEDGVRV